MGTLTYTAIPNQSEPGSNGNKELVVFYGIFNLVRFDAVYTYIKYIL